MEKALEAPELEATAELPAQDWETSGGIE